MRTTYKNVLWFVVGGGISLVISGVVYYILLLEIIDLFGFDELTDPEARHAKMFYTALVTTAATLLIGLVLNKMMYKKFALGFVMPSIIGIAIIVMIGPSYLNKSNYYEKFDKAKWNNETEDRIKMARQLIKNNELLGLSKSQVIEKLGAEFYTEDDNYISYLVYGDFCGLGIRFNNNERVVDCGIWAKD